MILKPQFGLDKMLFGMLPKGIQSLYGMPNEQIKDDEGNDIWIYTDKKLKLTFYKEENQKLGYIVSSNPNLSFNSFELIGKTENEVIAWFKKHHINTFEITYNEEQTSYFNEDNWLLLHFDFSVLVKIEVGAIIKNEDEFDWKS